MKVKLWDRALDALQLADGVLQRWGGFANLDAERWRELHRDAEAGRWERHFAGNGAGETQVAPEGPKNGNLAVSGLSRFGEMSFPAGRRSFAKVICFR